MPRTRAFRQSRCHQNSANQAAAVTPPGSDGGSRLRARLPRTLIATSVPYRYIADAGSADKGPHAAGMRPASSAPEVIGK